MITIASAPAGVSSAQNTSRRFPAWRAWLFVWSALLAATTPAHAAKWEPISPEDLAATESKAYPNADAEVLLERRTMIDEPEGVLIENYKRHKIYTRKGVEDAGNISIDHPGTTTLPTLVARLVKPDGSSVELKRSAFVVTDVARSIGLKWKKTSLVVPGLEPGDIVECQWKAQAGGAYLGGYWDYLQRTIPVREVVIGIEANDTASLQLDHYCLPGGEYSRRSGRLEARFRNIPPFEAEQDMIPLRDRRGWFLVSSVRDEPEEATIRRINEARLTRFRNAIRLGKEVRAKAAELLAGAATDNEKLRRLYDFCQTSVTNLDFDKSDATQERLDQRERNEYQPQTAAKTLTHGGFTEEIDNLFAALASAAGFEVRQVRCAGRDEILNIRIPRGFALMDRRVIGVRVGETWRYFSPGMLHVPFGMLAWEQEGTNAMVTAKKDIDYVDLPVSRAADSVTRRVGHFKLEPDGTLEGTVEETLTGHGAIALKQKYWSGTKEECRRGIEEAIIARLSTAEVSEISWERLTDMGYPIVIRYRLRVPAFAAQVGERLVFTPSVFTSGQNPRFPAEKRVHPIMLPYTWAEKDSVEITLPEGWELEKASAPPAIGAPEDAVHAGYRIRVNPRTRTLDLERTLSVDRPGVLLFRAEWYPALKAFFDGLHRSDNHSLMIKPAAAPATTATAAQP